ncbi:MAG: MEKHLA domain-containing protein, partial [Candidatus Methanoperedens sp.]|nr:MEKHLA domain-containing protein [Candidatus Methanoperedens sp.]
RKDGTVFWGSLSSITQTNSTGEILLTNAFQDITERKLIEEALRESEQKYRNLFDSAVDAIITIDLEDRITSWNQGAERIFGWTSEAIGKNLNELTIPKDLQSERKKILRDALTGKNITGIETVRLRKDGRRVDVSLTFSPIINTEGKIIGLSGIVRDITERKQAEKERLRLIEEIKKRHGQAENLAMNLKKERDTLQIIMENTGTQLAYLDSNFNFVRVNSAYADGSGHKKGELIGKNYFELFPDPENKAIFERVRDTGEAVEFKARPFEFPDQPWRGTTYRDWTLTPIKEASGKVDRLVLSLVDVTERIKAEQATQKALTYAESIVDTVPQPLVIIDSSLRVKTANHAFYKIFKVSIEDTKDKLLYELGNRQWDIPELRKLLEEVIPRNKHVKDFRVDHEFPIIGKRTMLLNASSFYQDGAEMILLAIDDITEREKIEEVRLENERLMSASRARSEFLTVMSHELRTPLTSIIGYSILLKEKTYGGLNEKQEFYVDNTLTSSKHLLDLINGILDLAKIEAGKIELAFEDVSVPDTINEVLYLMKEKAAGQNIVLKKELDPAMSLIKADRQKFKQILFNLLSNALKFSKEDGGTVTISAKKEGNMAKISISDAGIGIREDDIPKLFQKFEQLDSGISRKYGGTGLGLAITKQLVELHGGKITVESRYREGSTFTFLLPTAGRE